MWILRSLLLAALLAPLAPSAAAMDAGPHTAARANLYLLADDGREPPRFERDRVVLFRCEAQGFGPAALEDVVPRPDCAERLSDGQAIKLARIQPLPLEPARTANSPWHAAYRLTLAGGESRILWNRAFVPADRTSGLAIETHDFGSPFLLHGFALLTDGQERDRCCHRSFSALEDGKPLWSLGYVYADAGGALWQDATMHVETFPGADVAYLAFGLPGAEPRRQAFVTIAAVDGRVLEPGGRVYGVDPRRLHAAVQAAGERLLPASRLDADARKRGRIEPATPDEAWPDDLQVQLRDGIDDRWRAGPSFAARFTALVEAQVRQALSAPGPQPRR